MDAPVLDGPDGPASPAQSQEIQVQEGLVQIVQPTGILDSTQAPEFRKRVGDCVSRGAKSILIDFADVTFMDSSGLGALVLALKTARSAGAKLYVCAIDDQVKMLFELTSMDRVFDIFEDQDAFTEFIRQSPASAAPTSHPS